MMKTKKVKKPIGYGYSFIVRRECLDSEHSDEKFGDWSEYWMNTAPSTVQKTSKMTSSTLTSTLDIPVGQTAYVVWAEWSSGDSFGWAEDREVEEFGIFSDVNSAVELNTALENLSGGSYNIKTSDGQTFTGHAAWDDYFSRNVNFHIAVVTILPESA